MAARIVPPYQEQMCSAFGAGWFDADQFFKASHERVLNWNKEFSALLLPILKNGKVIKNQEDEDQKEVIKKPRFFVRVLKFKGFNPDDVDLVVDLDHTLTVKGRKEVRAQGSSYSSYDLMEFKQLLDLPVNIDDEEITLTLNKEGHLVIKAPYLDDNDDSTPDPDNKQRKNSIGEVTRNVPIDTRSYLLSKRYDLGNRSNTKQFAKNLKVKDFTPEQVKVIVDVALQRIIIKGRREVREGDDVNSTYVLKEFRKVIDLPDNIEQSRVYIDTDCDGNLLVKAPLLR